MQVYLWGIGKGCDKVLKSLKKENVSILGIIDNNPTVQKKDYNGVHVLPFEERGREYDYIIITIVQYKAVLHQIKEAGIPMDKVISYHDENCWCDAYNDLFYMNLWKMDILEHKVNELYRIGDQRLRNLQYEVADRIRNDVYQFPIIKGREEAVSKIVSERKSLIRFGDGEFEIMAGKNRPIFQKYDEELSKGLIHAFQSDDERILIAIADNYGSLDIYKEDVADAIREYMTEEVREFHASLIDFKKTYYDTYMFKCYYPYKDKSGTEERVQWVKKIWNDRDVVIIEGEQTRSGVGNDLFSNVHSLKRILCPTQNAYTYYEEILNAALKLDKEVLILSVLGPAGKVMAYDLVQAGYQVVDIGQIDMDYEWYLAGQEMRVPIQNKYVSQLPPAYVGTCKDADYASQIIDVIGVTHV